MAAAELLDDLDVPASARLGLAFPGDVDQTSMVSAAGIGRVRLAVPQRVYNPRPGVTLIEELDDAVLPKQQQGLEVLLTLQSDADWAVRPETRGIANGTPLDLGVWASFVEEVVERYDGDGFLDAPGLLQPIRQIQFANEFMGTHPAGGWLGTVDELIDFLEVSYLAAKTAASETVVILGGIEPQQVDRLIYLRAHRICQQNPNFFSLCKLDQVKAAASAYNLEQEIKADRVYREAPYDWTAIHLYWNTYGDVIMDPYRINLIRELSGRVPIIATECGGPAVPQGESLVPEEHFIAAMERNLTGIAEGLEFLMWSFLAEGEGVSFARRFVPLLDESFAPKAGYWAYKLLASILEDHTRVDRISRGLAGLLGTNTFVVHKADGDALIVAWNAVSGTPETIQIPALQAPFEVRVTRVVDAATGEYTVGLETATDGLFTLDDLPVVIDPTP